MGTGENTAQISDQDLVELMERAQNRVEEKIAQLKTLEEHLSSKGERFLQTARNMKLGIIILGALIATRAITDGVWTDLVFAQKSYIYIFMVVVPYTVISVIIAILGGIDSAFKYGETAAEVNFLKVRCGTAVDDARAIWGSDVEVRGASQTALEIANALFARLNQHHKEVTTRLVQLGIPLPH